MGWLTRKRVRIMLKNYRKVYAAQVRSTELLAACDKIPAGKAKTNMIKTVKDYTFGLAILVKKIRENKIQAAEIDKIATDESNLMGSIAKLNKAEQERLRRLEEER